MKFNKRMLRILKTFTKSDNVFCIGLFGAVLCIFNMVFIINHSWRGISIIPDVCIFFVGLSLLLFSVVYDQSCRGKSQEKWVAT